MRSTTLVLTAFSLTMLTAPALATAAPDCGSDKACAMMAAHDGHQHEAMVQGKTPARQRVVVWFKRPVMIGRQILLGKYIIEHDTDRQARGEPCTYLYAANDDKVAAVMFHCTHLERGVSENPTVTLVSTGDTTGLQKLLEFQFAGETAAHGVPTGR